MARVLAIGDLHLPAAHPEYLAFVRGVRRRWKTDTTVFIGDVFDWAAISFHARQPDTPGPLDEYAAARTALVPWLRAFPTARVCIGNHDARVERLAASAGVPPQFIRSYADTWGTPGWEWEHEFHIDGVRYFHGTGLSGQRPALRAALASMTPTVAGHVHSQAGVAWSAGPALSVFGLDTGCGVDISHSAMAYGRNLISKPVLGCGVVIDGHPYYERFIP